MARSDTLPVYIDTYQFVREVYQITHKFPREFKYCLGEQMNHDVLQLLYHIFQANHMRGDKTPELDAFMAALDMVRVEIRLAHDMQVLSTRQIAHLALFLDNIIKQATAWRKYQKATPKSPTGKEEQTETVPESDDINPGSPE